MMQRRAQLLLAAALSVSATSIAIHPGAAAGQFSECDPHEAAYGGGPFWQSDLMTDEAVLMTAPARGQSPEAQLLWSPTEVVAVRNFALTKTYRKGIDWTYEGNTLRLTRHSSAPSVQAADLITSNQPRLDNGHWFQTRQLAVTYKHQVGLWTGPISQSKLERLHAKLSAGELIKLSTLGDSITMGYGSSGFASSELDAIAPQLMPWAEVVSCRLQRRYGVTVELNNPSVAGMTSAWGREVVHDSVSATLPDLVVVAFGMNDGSMGVPAADYGANMQAIIDDVRAANPAADFILVAPMLANPAWMTAGDQQQYLSVLTTLAADNGAALVDMTTTHALLLEAKRYDDMTSNGVNHPNDFLARWYAYLVSAAIDAGLAN